MTERHDEPAPFEHRFHRALRRLRGRAVLRSAATFLPWLQVAWLVLFLTERLGLRSVPVPQTLTLLAGVLLSAALWTAWRSPTGRDAALVLDRRLATHELVTTAHEVAAAEPQPFVELARGRAAAALDRSVVAEALPLTSWRRWRPALLGLAAVLLAGLLPPLREQASASLAEPDPVVEAAAEELAEELAPLADEVAELGRPEAQDALQRLQELVDEMQRGDLPTKEDALVALNKTEEAIRELREEMAADGVDNLVNEMAGEPLSSDLAKAMSELDREALRESLRKMADALSPSEARSAAAQQQLERLAERFEEIAKFLEEKGGKDLAERVRELTAALESGDLGRAQEILESDQMQMALELVAQMGKGEDIGKSMGEFLQYARYLLGKQGPGALSQDGWKPRKLGQGSGPMPGDSSTNLEDGQGYKTGDPILRDRRSAETSDRTGKFEALYDSKLTEAEGLEDLQALGQVGEQGEMLSEAGRALGVEGAEPLPLRPFAAAASAAPERAMDLESVPLGYRDLVRDYFERNDREDRKKKDRGDG